MQGFWRSTRKSTLTTPFGRTRPARAIKVETVVPPPFIDVGGWHNHRYNELTLRPHRIA